MALYVLGGASVPPQYAALKYWVGISATAGMCHVF